MNTARQLLWLPTSREEKYKAKQAIDTFFVRFGDVLSAGVVYAGAAVLGLSIQQFAIVNIAMTLVWLGIAVALDGFKPALPRLRRPQFACAAVMIGFTLFASPAVAQDTREEVLARERAEKAANVQPYQPDRLEAALERVEEMLFSQRRMYTFIGGVMDSGGLALGPGYRHQFGDTGRVDVHAAWSIRNFKSVDAQVLLPAAVDGRVRTTLRANWIDASALAFYGTGIDSPDTRGEFAYRTTTIGADLAFQPLRHVVVGGGFDVLDVTARDLSNVTQTPTYGRSNVFAEFDSRTSPGYTRRGTLVRADLFDYRQVNDGASSFRRVDHDERQYVPLLRENWVIAVRALGSTTSTAGGNEVPYFLLPDLGGSKSLRGYSSWRFRDRNRLLLSAEWRWTAGPFVDMALFMDAGAVAPRVADLNWRDMKKSYGIGASFHTFTRTITRLEVARTTNGTSLGISFSPNF